jgi:hypothetical protein
VVFGGFLITITGYTDNPQEYNLANTKCRMEWGGCITSSACLNCGAINTDSLCLCIGIASVGCIACGHREEPLLIPWANEIDLTLTGFGV